MRIRIINAAVHALPCHARETGPDTGTPRAHAPYAADGAPGAAPSPWSLFVPIDEELPHLRPDLHAHRKR